MWKSCFSRWWHASEAEWTLDPRTGRDWWQWKRAGCGFHCFFLFSQCVHFSKKSFCTRCLSGACITLSKARTTWRWRILGTKNIPSIYPNLLHPGPLWDHLGLVCSGALQPWSSDMFPFRYYESGTEATNKPTQLFTSPASNQNQPSCWWLEQGSNKSLDAIRVIYSGICNAKEIFSILLKACNCAAFFCFWQKIHKHTI